MSRVSEDSPVPRHRAAPVTPGAEGAVTPSLAWKVCAVLPLVLLVVLMSVKVAGNFGEDDAKESSQTEEPGVVSSDDPLTPSPSETPSQSDAEKEREILSGAPDPSELPDAIIESEDPSTIPDSDFGMPPGPIDQTATPVPTKKPTKKPSPSQTPSPTPTPDEARDACVEAGVNVLDIAALAACIADMLDPN